MKRWCLWAVKNSYAYLALAGWWVIDGPLHQPTNRVTRWLSRCTVEVTDHCVVESMTWACVLLQAQGRNTTQIKFLLEQRFMEIVRSVEKAHEARTVGKQGSDSSAKLVAGQPPLPGGHGQ